jgi:hypothetical protein
MLVQLTVVEWEFGNDEALAAAMLCIHRGGRQLR